MAHKIKPRHIGTHRHAPPVVPVSQAPRPKWPESHVKIDHSGEGDPTAGLATAAKTLVRVNGGLSGIPPCTLGRKAT
jgi:hypothetical protein